MAWYQLILTLIATGACLRIGWDAMGFTGKIIYVLLNSREGRGGDR